MMEDIRQSENRVNLSKAWSKKQGNPNKNIIKSYRISGSKVEINYYFAIIIFDSWEKASKRKLS